MGKKRVLAGMRPTNLLHIGNYLGSTKGMLALQDNPKYETFYMVADLHAITTPYDYKSFQNATRNIVIDYIAAGLDPEKSILFVQSHVVEHVELAYLFSTVVSVARMGHLPTYKEKVKQHPKNMTMALLNYPVLMAADILIYKANLVPVGDDQLPHIEISREIARKMNQKYGTDFPEPEQFRTKGFYTPSLTGEGKMSKSVEGSYIRLADGLETIKNRIAKIPTDSGEGIVKGAGNIRIDINVGRPDKSGYKYVNKETGKESSGVGVLMKLVELFIPEKLEAFQEKYTGEGIRYSDLKSELAEAIHKEFKPIQKRRKELEAKPEYVDKVIKEGAEKARKVARQTLKEVKKAMGLT